MLNWHRIFKGTTLAVSLVMLVSCFVQSNAYVNNPESSPQSVLPLQLPGFYHPLPKFRKTKAKALLMGNATLYDSNLIRIKELDIYNGCVVDVVAVSDQYDLGFDDYQGDTCVRFNYTHIRHKDFEGVVKGRHVYRVIDSPQNREIHLGKQSVKLLATSSYAEKEEWSPHCVIDTYNETPLLFIDSRSGYKGYLPFINGNEFRLNTSFMELAVNKNDETAVSVKVVGEGFETKIRIRFQTAPDVGDDPPAPAWIEIRRESHGSYKAFIHPKK